MKSTKITIERFDLVSKKSFEQVLFELDKGIGRPIANYFERKAVTQSFEEYEGLVNGAIGTSDLVEFLRFDPGAVFRKDPAAKELKMVRIIAGNPLLMKKMAERVPDAASYAPVTILVSEREDGVHLSYDTMSSYLAQYGDLPALEVARDLDEKVISLLDHAAN